jgi:hypothetical protein
VKLKNLSSKDTKINAFDLVAPTLVQASITQQEAKVAEASLKYLESPRIRQRYVTFVREQGYLQGLREALQIVVAHSPSYYIS